MRGPTAASPAQEPRTGSLDKPQGAASGARARQHSVTGTPGAQPFVRGSYEDPREKKRKFSFSPCFSLFFKPKTLQFGRARREEFVAPGRAPET